LCLHDATALRLEQQAQPTFVEVAGTAPVWWAVAVLSVRQGETVRSLVYLLRDRIRECAAATDWPFSKANKHWLYDEIDVAGERGFVHRILFSDGTVTEIPFVSVVVSTLELSRTGGKRARRRTA
jgi:hypothetical protein